MHRLALLLFAAAASPVVAQTPYYSAEAVVESAQDRFVVRESIWRCAGTQCVSGPSARRHALVCSGLANRVGELRRFAVAGREFSAEELAACNAKAQ